MIKIKIERFDKPDSVNYTNTGLSVYLPEKEEFEYWEDALLDCKSVYLEFDQDWNIFSSPLMNQVGWYARTFFPSAKKLNISIDIEEVDK